MRILHDTGASQSLLLAKILSLSNETSCQLHVITQSIGMGIMKVPLCNIQLQSSLVTGMVRVGICEHLPVKDTSLILGNDLAGEKVDPLLEITNIPRIPEEMAF